MKASSQAPHYRETFKRISRLRALGLVRRLARANAGSDFATAARAAYLQVWGELPAALRLPHTPTRKD